MVDENPVQLIEAADSQFGVGRPVGGVERAPSRGDGVMMRAGGGGKPAEPSGREALMANAKKALEMKKAAPPPFRPDSRTPHTGMPPLPNPTVTPEGALEAEGAKPAMDRSHSVR